MKRARIHKGSVAAILAVTLILAVITVLSAVGAVSAVRGKDFADNKYVKAFDDAMIRAALWSGIGGFGSRPYLSKQSGIYDEPFELTIAYKKGYDIYYTLDGSNPDENSIKYTEPVKVYDRSDEPNIYRSQQRVVEDWKEYTPDTEPVDKAFIIKSVAIDKAGISSDTVCASYFTGDKDWDRGTGNIISLMAEPDEIFGEDGIYVTGRDYDEWYESQESDDEDNDSDSEDEDNDDSDDMTDNDYDEDEDDGDDDDEAPMKNYDQKGRDWEIKGNMELLRAGDSVDNEPVGIRISGRYSRSFPLKRLSLYARDEYSGSDRFDTELFGGKYPVHSVVLRNGTSGADVFFSELTKDRSPVSMSTEEAAVYLNGEYWYTAPVREKLGAAFFKEHFGIEKDNLFTVKNGWEDVGSEADYPLFTEIYDYINTHDLSDPSAYEGFNDIIDIQNYIDCQCINVYAENMDYDERNNTFMWRAKKPVGEGGGDARWRWALYDLDSVELNGQRPDIYDGDPIEINVFTMEPASHAEPLGERPIFKALKQNPEFRKQFVLSFMDIINTDFSEKKVSEVLEKYGKDTGWNNGFFERRADYVIPQLAEEFDLKGSPEEVTLKVNDPDGGKVVVNTCEPDISSGEWTGKYFTDYPIELTAIPNEGYRFAGWSVSGASDATKDITSKDMNIELTPAPGGTTVRAEFEKIR